MVSNTSSLFLFKNTTKSWVHLLGIKSTKIKQHMSLGNKEEEEPWQKEVSLSAPPQIHHFLYFHFLPSSSNHPSHHQIEHSWLAFLSRNEGKREKEIESKQNHIQHTYTQLQNTLNTSSDVTPSTFLTLSVFILYSLW